MTAMHTDLGQGHSTANYSTGFAIRIRFNELTEFFRNLMDFPW